MSLISKKQIDEVRKAWLGVFKPPPTLTVSEWADQFRQLSSEASAEPGQWRTSKAEYQRGIMDALSDPKVVEVSVMSSAQVGKTEFLLNALGYFIHQDPSPILMVQPTIEMAEVFSKDRIAPMARDTKVLTPLIGSGKSKDSSSTILKKSFPGGQLKIAGANSPASLASMPIRIVLQDEVDRYPFSAGDEGDPGKLAEKRTTTFVGNKKIVRVSTPTIKGISRIEKYFAESSQNYFHVPCHECGHADKLHFSTETVYWPKGEPEKAVYICQECGAWWDDAKRYRNLKKGYWVSMYPERVKHQGFHLSELCSPWVPLGEVATNFVRAKKGGPEQLQVFINTSLGETWDAFEDTGLNKESLMDRLEAHNVDILPDGAALITAAVDFQVDRAEIQFMGWGEDDEAWVLDYVVVYGDPTGVPFWQELDDALVGRKFVAPNGLSYGIDAAALDSGYATQSVYDYCAKKLSQFQKIYPIKGVPGFGKPIWERSKAKLKGGVKLFLVGADTAKNMVLQRLKVKVPGPGFIHLPVTLDENYFDMLLCERIMIEYNKAGFATRKFHKPDKANNEAIDTAGYNFAARRSLNIDVTRRLAEFQRVEQSTASAGEALADMF